MEVGASAPYFCPTVSLAADKVIKSAMSYKISVPCVLTY